MLDHRRRRIHTQHVRHRRQEVGRELAVAAADVQDAVGRLRVEIAEDGLCELGHEGGGCCVGLEVVSRRTCRDACAYTDYKYSMRLVYDFV